MCGIDKVGKGMILTVGEENIKKKIEKWKIIKCVWFYVSVSADNVLWWYSNGV